MKNAWAQDTIRCHQPHRPSLPTALHTSGIPTAVYDPVPFHLQDAFRTLGYPSGDLPVSEQASREVLSLPFGPYLRPEDVSAVTGTLARGA